ncbi:MAG: alpha/beta hydrolase [Acidimicrobiia bacterium]|nr:alpha/beta hydrolase [Acidimicrobiia bacterium]
MADIDAVHRALAARGAGEIPHPGGTLLAHLVRTSELLRSWGADPMLVRAGLAHAAYGTDGFARALFGWDERSAVIDLVGPAAEGIVHRYARCDRGTTYPRLVAGAYRDRIDGSTALLGTDEVHALAELTVANELDVVRHCRVLREQHGAALRALLAGWRGVMSVGALDECRHVLGPAMHVGADDRPEDVHVVVDGVRLHLLDWGGSATSTVVLLHGGGLQAHTWDAVAVALRTEHRCVAVDLRGHGDSEWSPTCDYTIDAHAHDLAGVLAALGVSRPIVVGHSLGGFAALRLAARRSADLAGLVIVDTSPFVRETPLLAKIREFVQAASVFETFDDAIDHALGFRRSTDRDRLRSTLRHSLRLLPDGRWTWKRDQRHLKDGYIESTMQAAKALVPDLGAIGCPTLVVRGDHGTGHSDDDYRRFVDRLPDARLETVTGAGHNVQSDNPAGLVDAIKPFLDSASFR